MNNRFLNCVSEIKAPERPLDDGQARRILEMTSRRIPRLRRTSKTRKRTIMLLVAAALFITICAGTVYALVSNSAFIRSALGNTGLPSNDVYEYTNELGQTWTVPANERVDVDDAQVDKEIGDYIVNVNASTTIGDYTFTVESYVVDDNGIGSLTYIIENPNGVDLFESIGRGAVNFREEYEEGKLAFTGVSVYSEPVMLGSSREFLDLERTTDTRAVVVTSLLCAYPTYSDDPTKTDYPPDMSQGFPKVYFCVTSYFGPIYIPETNTFAETKNTLIELPRCEPVPSTSFGNKAENISAKVSPFGIVIEEDINHEPSPVGCELTVHYMNGDSYLVEGKGVANVTGASQFFLYTFEGGRLCTARCFNRMIEPKNIDFITINDIVLKRDGNYDQYVLQ